MAAPEVVHHIQELSHLANPDFLTALKNLGHPYNLLISSSNPDSLPQSSQDSIARFAYAPILLASKIFHLLSPELAEFADNYPSSFSSMAFSLAWITAPSIGFWGNVSGASFETSCEDIQLTPSSENTLKTTANVSIATSLLWASALFITNKSNLQHPGKSLPILALAMPLQDLIEKQQGVLRHRELHIGTRSLTFGTASLRLSTYRGAEPFVVKSPDGTPVTEIKPGDPLAHMHVSHNAFTMRDLSPLEKARAITADTIALLFAIDQVDPTSLSPEQQQTHTQAKNATIIGISHLVRLFRRATGLPTWKLDVLPEIMQRFHTLDSQLVSDQFGGQRRVKPEDVEMLVITPSQRRQLLARPS